MHQQNSNGIIFVPEFVPWNKLFFFVILIDPMICFCYLDQSNITNIVFVNEHWSIITDSDRSGFVSIGQITKFDRPEFVICSRSIKTWRGGSTDTPPCREYRFVLKGNLAQLYVGPQTPAAAGNINNIVPPRAWEHGIPLGFVQGRYAHGRVHGARQGGMGAKSLTFQYPSRPGCRKVFPSVFFRKVFQ